MTYRPRPLCRGRTRPAVGADHLRRTPRHPRPRRHRQPPRRSHRAEFLSCLGGIDLWTRSVRQLPSCVSQSAESQRADRSPRYTDARLTPSTRAMVATSCSPDSCIAFAVASFSSVHTVGRPPVRPRARSAPNQHAGVRASGPLGRGEGLWAPSNLGEHDEPRAGGQP